MDFVLDEEMGHRKQGTKESKGKEFPVLCSLGVLRGRLDGANDMRECAEQVDNHGDIMDIMVIRGSDEYPSTTRYSPDKVVGEESLGKALGSIGRDIAHGLEIPKVAQHQTRT